VGQTISQQAGKKAGWGFKSPELMRIGEPQRLSLEMFSRKARLDPNRFIQGAKKRASERVNYYKQTRWQQKGFGHVFVRREKTIYLQPVVKAGREISGGYLCWHCR
jgi:hypothetical protein